MPKTKTSKRELLAVALRTYVLRAFAICARFASTPVRFVRGLVNRTPVNLYIRAGVLTVLFAIFATGTAITITGFQPAHTAAATSSTLNFQARLMSVAGSVAADGNYNIEFKLYDALTGGTLLWTETRTNFASNGVTVRNGYVTVNLGSVTAFPSTINWNQPLWLTMNIGGTSTGASPTWDGEMAPRLALTAVPYAFRAGQLAVTNGTFTSTLNILGPTGGSQTFNIPDQGAAGTYTLLTTNTANSSYIQNTGVAGGPQTANFNIQSTSSGVAGSVAATIRGASAGQTADLLQFLNTSGSTTLAKVDASGNFFVPAIGDLAKTGSYITFNAAGTNSGSVGISTRAATNVGLVVRATSGQSVDLVEFQDSSSNTLARISSTGVIGSGDTSTASTNSGNTVIQSGNATGTTSNSGNVSIDVGTATGTKGQIQIGTTSAASILEGHSGITTTNQGAVTVNQLLTAGGGLTVNSGSVFTNASATLNTSLATLPDFPTGGSLGLASATVDIATTITINQTTPGKTITIPNPTNTAAGRLIYLSNIGSTAVIISNTGLNLAASGAATLLWNGTAWTASSSGNFINNSASLQGGATFNIAGSGTSSTSFIAPLIDTASATTLSLGTGTANAVSIGRASFPTTINGSLTSSQLLTASNGFTVSAGTTSITGTTNINTTGSAVTTIGNIAGPSSTIVNGTLTVNSSGTSAVNIGNASTPLTIASSGININTTGQISSGSIVSGFGTINTAQNITTSATIQGGNVNATTAYQFGGNTLLTGAALTFTTAAANSVTGANNQSLTVSSQGTGALTLQSGSGTVSLGSSTGLTATAALSVKSGGTSNVTLDTTNSSATVFIGATANTITEGHTGSATTNNGAVTVTQLLTANGGLTVAGTTGITGTTTINTGGTAATSIGNTTGAFTLTSPNIGISGGAISGVTGFTEASGIALFDERANSTDQLKVVTLAGAATASTTDQVFIDNSALTSGQTQAGVNNLDLKFLGQTSGGAVENGSLRIDLTPNTVNAGVTDGMHVVATRDNTTGSTQNAIKVDGIASGGLGTNNAINIGTNWNSVLMVGANSILNGTGVLQSVALSGTYTNQLILNNATNQIYGDGSNLTALNGSNIATGTINTARLDATTVAEYAAPTANFIGNLEMGGSIVCVQSGSCVSGPSTLFAGDYYFQNGGNSISGVGGATYTLGSKTGTTNSIAIIVNGNTKLTFDNSSVATFVSGTAIKVGANTILDASSNLANVTYQGNVIATQYGGTGVGTFTTNGVLYGNGTGAIGVTGAGTTGQCLISTTSFAPVFGSCAGSGSGSTLQAAYNNSPGSTTPEIVEDSTRTTVDIQGYSGQSDDLLDLRSYTASGLGALQFGVTPAGAVTEAGALTVSSGGASITGGLNLNSGNVTNGGQYNLQTISAAANFTGTVVVATSLATPALNAATSGGTLTTNLGTLQRTAVGTTTVDLKDGSATTLAVNNSGAGVANLNLVDGDLYTNGADRLSNAGALQAITGYTQTAGSAAYTLGSGNSVSLTSGAAPNANTYLQTISNSTFKPTANNAGLQSLTFNGTPSGTNQENAQSITVTNSNGAAGGQVNGIYLNATGAGGSIASDVDGIFIDNLSNKSTGATQNAIEIGTNWTNDLMASGNVVINGSGDLNLSNVYNTLSVANGGTGVNGSTAANGQLLVGNGAGFSIATVGTSNGITTSVGAGTLSIGLTYGSGSQQAAQGNTSLNTTFTGSNLTGSLTGTAGGGFSANTLAVVATPTFTSVTSPTYTGAGAVTLSSGGISALTLQSASATGDIISNNQVTHAFTRTVPTTLNNEVDLGSFAFTNGGGSLYISVTIPSSAFSVAKEYNIPIAYNATAGAWQLVAPISDTGAYSGTQDVSLEINVNNGTASLRLRRSLGTTAGTAYISITQQGINTDAFTGSSATSSVAAPTAYYSSSVLTQTGNDVTLQGSGGTGDFNIASGSLEIGGQQVVTSTRILQNIASISQTLLPTTTTFYDLGSAAATWKTGYFGTGGVLTPLVDTVTAGTLSIGTSTANAISIGKVGVTTTVGGPLTSTGLVTANGGLTVAGATGITGTTNINITGSNVTSIGTGSNSGAINIGNAGAAVVIASSGTSLTGAVTLNTLGTTNNSAFLCRNTSSVISACNTTGTGAAFVQGGNSFGAQAVLGTIDNNSLAFKTNNTTKLTLDTAGSLQFSQASTINTSAGALTLQSAAGSNLILNSGTAGGTISTNAGTIQRTAVGTTNIDLNDTGTTTLQIENSGSGVANLNLFGGALETGSTPVVRLTNAGGLTHITGYSQDSGSATFSQNAADLFKIQAAAVPTTDMSQITNSGFPITTDAINAQQIDYYANLSSAAFQSSALRVNVTNTSTVAGSTTNALRVVATGAVAGTTNGIKIDNFTSGTGGASALYLGTGWKDLLSYNGSQLITGLGKLNNNIFDNTVTYSNLTGVGALVNGSIATGFGVINTGNNITTSATVQGGNVNATTAYQFGGNTLLTGAALTFTTAAANSVTGANNQSLTVSSQGTGALTLQSGSGTVSLGSSTALTATGALTVKSGGVNTLTLDTGSAGTAAINIGNTNATSISIGRASQTTTVNGPLTVASSQLFTANGGATIAGTTSITGATSINTSGALGTTIGNVSSAFILASPNIGISSGSITGVLGYSQSSGNATFNQAAATSQQVLIQQLAGLATGTTDQLVVDNTLFTNGQTLAGVNNVNLKFHGSNTTAVENGSLRVDVTPGTFSGSVTNGLRVVQNIAAGPATGVTSNGVKLEGPTTGGAGTYNAINISNIGTVISGGVATGLNITPTNSNPSGGTEVGINIGNITAGAASETAIKLGTGWDNLLTYGATPTVIINGGGQLNAADAYGTLPDTSTSINVAKYSDGAPNFTGGTLQNMGNTVCNFSGNCVLGTNVMFAGDQYYQQGGNNMTGVAGDYLLGSTSAHNLTILTNNINRLTVDTSGNVSLLTGGLEIGASTVITSGSVLQNVTANTSILTAGTLPTTRGGTGLSSFANSWGVLYSSSTSALAVTAAGSAGQCLVSNATSAPTWQSCASAGSGAADQALDNLSAVAINTSLLPSLANNNLIDLGSATKQFRTGYFGTSVISPSLTSVGATALGIDTGAAGTAAINIGTGNATSISLGRSGQTTTNNGALTVSQLLTASASLSVTNGNVSFAQTAVGDHFTLTNNQAAPTNDIFNITNSAAITANGINALSINYTGGAGAIESAAQRIDLTPGGTSGAQWSGLRVVHNATGPATGVTSNGIKVEGPITTGGAGTFNALNIANIGKVTTGGTVNGLNITGTNSNAAGTVNGININAITGGGATETAIRLNSGWDNLLTYNAGATVLIDNAGNYNLNQVFNTLAVGHGGTGLATTPTNGQLLIGNGAGYTLGTITNNGGLTVSNGAGTLGLAVNYGSGASNAAAGANTITVTASTNLSGGGTVTIGTGGTVTLQTVTNPSFSTSVSSPILQSIGATALSIDTGATGTAAINIGNTNATSISLGRSGQTTTVNGALTVSQLLTASAGLSVTNGNIAITQTANGDHATISNTSAAPANDFLNIANTNGVTTGGVNALSLTYKGGAGAIESAAEKIDLTPGATSGAVWSGLRLTEVNGPATGVTTNDIKLEGPTSAGAGNYNALNIANIGSTTTGGTVTGLNITPTNSNAAGTEVGINIGALTAGAATENAIQVGAGWDNILYYNGATSLINSAGQWNLAQVTGQLPILNGGTNATTIGVVGTVAYSTGTAYSFTAAPISNGLCLTSNTAGAPSWTSCASGSVTGSGTAGTLPVYTGAGTTSTLGNSIIVQNSTTAIGIGTTTTAPASLLSVGGTTGGNFQVNSSGALIAGTIATGFGVINTSNTITGTTLTGSTVNSTGTYQIGGTNVLTSSALQFTAASANTVTSTSGQNLTVSSAGAGALTLQSGSGTVSLGSSTVLNASAALTVRSGGATALGIDTGGAAGLSLGTANANAITIGKNGVLTTNTGTLTVSQLLTASAGFTQSNGSTAISQTAAADHFTITNNQAAPTNDIFNITNSAAITSAGKNALSINYTGGAGAIESAAQRIDIQPGTTSGALWSGLRIVQGTNTIPTGVITDGVKLEGPTTGGAGTYSGVYIPNIGATTTGGTINGINIGQTTVNAAGAVNGINIANGSGGGATEDAINVSTTGWDNILQAGANTLITGTGKLNLGTVAGTTVTGNLTVTNGGTGLTSIASNSLVYGSGSTALNVLAPSATGGFCLVTATALSAPSWASCGALSANQTLSNLSAGLVQVNTDLTYAQGGNRALNISQATSGVGNNLTVTAGQGATTGNQTGGNLILQGGAGGGTGQSGSVLIQSNGTNSATAFQVQNATGGSFFTANSINQSITTKTLSVGSPANTATSARLFSDGFESGDPSLWDGTGGSGTISYDTATVYDGSYSGKIVTAANGGYFQKGIAASSTVFARAYFDATTVSNPTPLIDLGPNAIGGASHLYVLLNASDDICYSYNGGAAVCSATVASTSTWHKLEVKMVAGTGANGVLQIFLDNNLVTGTVNVSTGAWTASASNFALGNAVSSTSTVYYDDAAVDTVATGDASSLYVTDSLHVAGSADFGGQVNAETAFSAGGNTGISTGCTGSNTLQSIVITGGIVTGGACALVAGTLQNAYDNSSTNTSVSTPALVSGHQWVGQSATASYTIVPSGITSGNLLVLHGSIAASTSKQITSIVDNGGNTWHRAIRNTGNSGQDNEEEIWYAYNVVPTTLITVTVTAGGAENGTVSEYSGVDNTADPLISGLGNQILTNTASSTTSTLTVSTPNALLYTGMHYADGGITAVTDPGSPWAAHLTDQAYTTAPNGAKLYLNQSWQTVSTSGSYSATWTFTGSDQSNNGIVAFRPKASGGSTIAAIELASGKDLVVQNSSAGAEFTFKADGSAVEADTDLHFGSGANRAISVLQVASGTGNNLTISAGQGGASGNQTGGNLNLFAGAGTGSGNMGTVNLQGNGVVITQASASQTADTIDFNDSTGATMAGIDANGFFIAGGQTGISSGNCSGSEVLAGITVTQGIVTAGSCAQSSANLQDAYNNSSVAGGGTTYVTPTSTHAASYGCTVACPSVTIDGGHGGLATSSTGVSRAYVVTTNQASAAANWVTGVTDSFGNTYAKIQEINGTSGDNTHAEMWYVVTTQNITSVTITMHSNTYLEATLTEIDNIASYDNSLANMNTATTTPTTPSVTVPAHAEAVITSLSTWSDNVTAGPTNGFTTSSNYTNLANGTTDMYIRTAYLMTTTAGSYGSGYTLASSRTSTAITASFIPTTTGGSTTIAQILLSSGRDLVIDDSTGNNALTIKADGSGIVLGGTFGASDPSPVVSGGMYYNSSTNTFRCAENGAWRNCSQQYVAYTSDVANNTSGTYSVGPNMPIKANKTYNVQFIIPYVSDSVTTTGMTAALTGPAGSSYVACQTNFGGATTLAEDLQNLKGYVGTDTINTTNTAAASTLYVLVMNCTIKNGATPGNVNFEFHTEVNGRTITVKAGASYNWLEQ